MNIERIKRDLAKRVQKLITDKKALQSDNPSKSWKDKIADTECLVQKVYETLYDILQSNGIELSNDKEFDGLISLLEPSVNDIIIRNMKD